MCVDGGGGGGRGGVTLLVLRESPDSANDCTKLCVCENISNVLNLQGGHDIKHQRTRTLTPTIVFAESYLFLDLVWQLFLSVSLKPLQIFSRNVVQI